MDGSEEPTALGASATIAAGKRSRRGAAPSVDGGSGSGRERRSISDRVPRPRMGPVKGFAFIVLAATLVACVPIVASSLKKTPRDKVGISYGGGPIEGSHFQKIVQPGSTLFFNGLFDSLYLYPADQRNYIVSMVESEGAKEKADSVVAPSQDRVQVSYQVAVYYKLNTDRLRSFHEEFGLKYQAFTADGWRSLIEDTFRQQIENALQEETRRHPVGDIYGDAELLLQIQESVQTTLSERLQLAMGEQYFCAPTFRPGGECADPTFVIKKVELPDSVVAAFEANKNSQIAIETERNRVTQREQEALGAAALRDAVGEFGPIYAQLKAIESGVVNFWVLPNDGNVAIQTPEDGGAPAAPATDGAGAGG